VFGPGPVAETFPEPLHPLEVDLFAVPMRDAIVRALRTTGAATEHQLAGSPVLTTLSGRVAVDLELLGITRGHRSWRSAINPALLLRRLASAWRVGRARTALPVLGAQVVASVDDHLEGVGPLHELHPSALLDLLDGIRRELVTTHAYEILAGMLLHHEPPGASGAAVAMAALARGRADGLTDPQLIARHPEVLALVPPAIAPPPPLPPAPAMAPPRASVDDLGLREGLRLRCRWLQELAARTALELGARLAAEGTLPSAGRVRTLSLGELHAALADGALPEDLDARAAAPAGPPLPDAFRLSASGEAVPARHRGPVRGGGIPAGGGRVTGTARHRVAPGSPRTDAVLVTRHLEPQLAPLLPSLAGLVSETGSALSHLAILAREMQVPTVVGVPDALVRFPPGSRLLVDGTTGEVLAIDDEEAAS
jgi:pyruvate,water dikinase